jgi:hypothetical protein
MGLRDAKGCRERVSFDEQVPGTVRSQLGLFGDARKTLVSLVAEVKAL